MSYIFNHSTKLYSGANNNDGGTGLTLGFAFCAFGEVTVTHVTFWKLATDTATSRPVAIWDNTGALIATGFSADEPVGVGQWIEAPLSEPLVLSGAGLAQSFTAAVYFAQQKYPAVASGLNVGAYSADGRAYALATSESTGNLGIGSGSFKYGAGIQRPDGGGGADFLIDIKYSQTDGTVRKKPTDYFAGSSITLEGWYRSRDSDGVIDTGADFYNGTAITNWTDRSGKARTLVKEGTLTFNKPGIGKGVATVDSAGAGAFRTATGQTYPAGVPINAFAVVFAEPAQADKRIISAISPSGHDAFGATSGIGPIWIIDSGKFGNWFSFNYSQLSYNAANPAGIFEGYATDATHARSAYDGVAGPIASSGINSPSLTRLGFGTAAQGEGYLNGKFAELVVVFGQMTADDVAFVEGYLAWNNGLQSQLPTGHTYKGAPPLSATGGGTGPTPISGAASITDAADTASGSGTVKVSGSAAIVDAGDTASAAGAIKISGAASVLDGSDIASGAGAVKIAASGSVLDGNDTAVGSGSGTPLPPISGSAAVAEGNDTADGSGSLKTSGAAAVVDGNDLASSSGALAIRGTAAVSDADDIASGSGSVKVSGAGSVIDAGDTAAGSGRASISGAGSVTDADDTASGSSTAYGRSEGTADLKEADDAAAGSGTLKIRATATIVDADDGATGAGSARIGAQASVAMSDDTSLGVGSVRLLATALVNFTDDTAAGFATVKISGASSAAEADDFATGIGFEIKQIVGSASIVDEDDRASGFGVSREPVRHRLAAFVAPPFAIEAVAASPVTLIGRIKPPAVLVGFLGEVQRRGFDLQKITHLQGDSFLGEATVKDRNGIISLVGAVLSWRISERADDPVPLIEKTISDGGIEVVDAVNGRVNLRLSAIETDIPARDYYHQLSVTFPNGERATVIREYLTIVETL